MNKVFVLSSGANGVILWADFNNIFNLSTYLSGGVFSTGIIRQNAEQNGDIVQVNKAYIAYSACMCMVVFLILIFVGGSNSEIGQRVVVALAVAANTIVLLYTSKLNGKMHFRPYFKYNFQIAILPLVFTLSAYIIFEEASTIVYCIGIISASLLMARSIKLVSRVLSIKSSILEINHRSVFHNIFPYALQSAVTFVLPVLFQLGIRKNLQNIGTDAVVAWQITWSLNLAIVSIIGSSFMTLLLPYFASRKIKDTLNKTTVLYFMLLCFATFGVYAVNVILGEKIITILYSSDVIKVYPYFESVLNLTYLKILSWLLGIIALSKGYLKTIILVDILFYGSMYSLSALQIESFYQNFDDYLFYSLIFICFTYSIVILKEVKNES